MSRAVKRLLEAPNKGGLTYTTVEVNNIALGLEVLIKALFAAKKAHEEAKKEMTASCSSNLSDLIPIESAAPEFDVPSFRKCRPYSIQQQIGTRPSKW